MADHEVVNVRYLVDDVDASVDFYTRHFGFVVGIHSPAFADVTRGNLRLLLSGPASSAGRAMSDGERPAPGGWNRIHLIVDDIEAEVARLSAEGVSFRNEIVERPGRLPGPGHRPVRELRRAVPTGRRLVSGPARLPRRDLHVPEHIPEDEIHRRTP